jgi:pterin-4a-carbinolamine dehydratase
MSELVFISYRRDDASAEASLIAKELRAELGEGAVFLDSSSVEFGATWPDRIRSALETCQYVFAVIGPDWLRAGSNEWGQRRIDDETDWVRQEIAHALGDAGKTIIPVVVRGARVPPSNVLPDDVAAISTKQRIELRRDYFDHDVKLLTAQVRGKATDSQPGTSASPYPRNVPIGPDPLDEEKLAHILATDLSGWRKVASALPEDPKQVRVELFREYEFRSFQEAVKFMAQLAPGCDIANHHPRWENVWRIVRVYLTTWDIGQRISDRDVQLARYFERAYSELIGTASRD